MSDGYSYIIEMVDRISGPAKSAQQQIAGMGDKLMSSSKELEKMRAQLAGLEQAQVVDIATRNRMVAAIDKTEASLIKQGDAIRKAVAAETEVAEAAKKAASGTEEVAKASTAAAKPVEDMGKKTFDASNAINVGKETVVSALGSMANAFKSLAAGDVKGAVQGVTDAVADMAKLLDLAVPGLGQAVSAVIKVAGGLVGITAGLIQSGAAMAIEANTAKTAMLQMFDALGGGITTGAKTEEMIDNLKARTSVAKDELVEYTKAVMAMGETDLGKIEGSVHAMASANAIMGKEGVGAFTALTAKIEQAGKAGVGLKLADKQLAQLYKTGVNVDDVAKKMGMSAKDLRDKLNAGTVDAAKFGDAMQSALIDKGKGPLDVMTSSLPNLKKLFMESLGDMFEDIDVKPFLASIKDLFRVFSQASPAGQAMKAGIGGFFAEVFATLTKVVPVVKSFFLDIVILALKAYIAAKPVVKTIAEFATAGAGASILKTILGSLWTVLKVLGVAVLVVVGVFVGLWAIMVAVGVAIWTLVGYALQLGTSLGTAIAGGVSAAISWLGGLLTSIVGIGASIWQAITGWVAGAAQGAADFVNGLVQGITNGGAAIVGAVKGLADSAVGTFKSALGIKSPSAVMAELGAHTTAGFEQGVEGGTDSAQGALEAVAAPPAAAPAGGASGGGGGMSITFAEGAIVIQLGGGGNAQEIAALLPAALTDALEQLLLTMGGSKA